MQDVQELSVEGQGVQVGDGNTQLNDFRVGEAVPLFEAALAAMEAVFGPNHPNTVTVRANLARARAELQAK